MKILIVGSGGREHAIIKTLIRQGFGKKNLYCAPGNAGISIDSKIVNIKPTEITKLKNWALNNNIDLTISSMDDSLAAGIVDVFEKNNLRIFGSTSKQAKLESSKIFAKKFMEKYNIPTAKFFEFTNYDTALQYVKTINNFPIVIKADGLALGKGVIIANSFLECKKALNNIMVKKVFGKSGNKIIIEEFLIGKEISILAFVDGKKMQIMPACKDHKKIFNNEKGPNTGGMGTFCPAINYNSNIGREIKSNILAPTETGLKNMGFKGVIFFGLILTKNGPKVLEYNARFGDPEAQVVLPLLKTPLIDIFNSCIDGNLMPIKWENYESICVMLASKGYPNDYKKGFVITGLDNLDNDTIVYHSGTSFNSNNEFTNNGGRVLGICSVKNTLKEASKTVYSQIKKFNFDGMQYRTDISK